MTPGNLAADIDQAIGHLATGGVVVFPTDTVYGIGAALNQPAALRRIFAIKGRSASKTLPILISNPEIIDRLARDVDDDLLELADALWPGPLTIVFPAGTGLPRDVVADDNTIALRMPDHPIALMLADACGGAIVTTSANPSGTGSLTTASEVRAALGDAPNMILDGGTTPGQIASTIIRPEGDTLTVLRIGEINAATLERIWVGIRPEGRVITGGAAASQLRTE